MKVQLSSFYTRYLISPLSLELTRKQKAIAVINSIAMGFLTLGILHLIVYCIEKNRVRKLKETELYKKKQISDIQNIIRTNIYNSKASDVKAPSDLDIAAARLNAVNNPQKKPKPPVTLSQVPKIIQKSFIEPFYAKKLPDSDKVCVPFDGNIKLWNELTLEQKIELINKHAHPHDRLDKKATAEQVERKLFTSAGQKVYLPRDPRKHHGSDHCVRASLFATVFLYLYVKYLPECPKITETDLSVLQLTAAGHDSGRQTEGPDIYDEWSADNTRKVLTQKGIDDQEILQDCIDAIANKDSKDYTKKSIIAKCVQNADSAEFSRLMLTGPLQDEKNFKNSRGYLDIFNEISKIDGPLNEGRTSEEFIRELDAFRTEMNRFIYHTHKETARVRYAKSENYYDAIIQDLTSAEYPLLYHTLVELGIKKIPNPLEVEAKHLFTQAKAMIGQGGLKFFPHKELKLRLKDLKNMQENTEDLQKKTSEKIKKYVNKLISEKKQRAEAKAQFLDELEICETSSGCDLSLLMKFYGRLSLYHRDKYFPRVKAVFNDSDVSEDGIMYIGASFRADLEHERFKEQLKENASSQSINELHINTKQLLVMYANVPTKYRDPRIQTSCALAYEKIFTYYRDNQDFNKAQEILEEAGKVILIEQNHPLVTLQNNKWKGGAPHFFMLGSSFPRKRQVRAQQKDYNDKSIVEISMEATSKYRSELIKNIAFLKSCGFEIETARAVYPRSEKLDVELQTNPFENGYLGSNSDYGSVKFSRKDVFQSQDALEFGREIILKHNGITVKIGNDKWYWVQYNHIRIEMDPNTPIQDLHKTLSLLGLPMALTASRPEDIKMEMMARAIFYRYPQKVFEPVSKKQPKKSTEELYQELSLEEKAQIEKDIAATQFSVVGNSQTEMINPNLGDEAKQQGVRALGMFISAGDKHNTSRVIASMMLNGALSSQERFQRGILGLGCCPQHNYATGAANQVFTRALTQRFFEQKTSLRNFAITGPVLVLLDPKAFERMPYSYNCDRGGLRNPNFHLKRFAPQKQETIFDFKGHERLMDRKGIDELCGELQNESHYLTETMFDTALSPHYIKKLVVEEEEQKTSLIAELERNNIFHIGGLPLPEAIHVASNLDESMVDNI